ncbi:MAG: alpha/beta hydrolase, partial [Bacteroidota bacterium]
MLNEQQKQMLGALAYGLSTPPRTPILKTPEEYGMAFEEVAFETKDGVAIKGWFIPANSNKVVISNHFSPGNKYGFAGHLEGLDFAGGFEVNFLPRYKALHDAGYNVLAYDLRSHGDSADGEGKISGVGYYEWQEVLASIKFVKQKLESPSIGLSSMCIGANATINAMQHKPEVFEDIKCMLCIALLKGRTTIERQAGQMGIDPEEAVAAFEPMYTKITGLTVADHNIIPKLESVHLQTLE